MQRILIADPSKMFAEGIAKRLNNEFLVNICTDGRKVLRQVLDFEPDIILLDMALPGCDGISLLETIRAAGRMDSVVATSANLTMPVQQILSRLGVVYVFSKPCLAENVACFLRQLALGESGLSAWTMETELDNTLLRLGFRCGKSGYECTYEAICLRYANGGNYTSKCLYIDVRRICGKKSSEAVEKAIRDAIKIAWENGDPNVWDLYFNQGENRECPTNDVFIGRIVRALQNRERLKRPYKQKVEILKEA